VHLLLDALTSGVHDPLGVSPASADPGRIAVVGHSLGGADVLHVAFHTCCKDPRITAAATFEAPVGGIDGPFDWRGPPLLAVVGDQDPLLPHDVGPLLLRSLETPGFC
jgi:dienelactone hydrolase